MEGDYTAWGETIRGCVSPSETMRGWVWGERHWRDGCGERDNEGMGVGERDNEGMCGERDKMFCEHCIQYGGCMQSCGSVVHHFEAWIGAVLRINHFTEHRVIQLGKLSPYFTHIRTMCVVETSMGDYTANCYRLMVVSCLALLWWPGLSNCGNYGLLYTYTYHGNLNGWLHC